MGLRLHIGNIPSTTNLHYDFLQNSIYTRGYKYILLWDKKGIWGGDIW